MIDARIARIGSLIAMWLVMLFILSLVSNIPIHGWPLMATIIASHLLGGLLTAVGIAVWQRKL